MVTRCVENSVFAITANRCGADRRPHATVRFTGRSQIVGPRGEILCRAHGARETLHVETLDPRRARDKNLTRRNHVLKDRRPELYSPS
jgi:predicted amidohydrolase